MRVFRRCDRLPLRYRCDYPLRPLNIVTGSRVQRAPAPEPRLQEEQDMEKTVIGLVAALVSRRSDYDGLIYAENG